MISKHKKYSPEFGHDLSRSLFVFLNLFQQLKCKLESLLAVYFMGISSGTHHFSKRPQLTDVREQARGRTKDRVSAGQYPDLKGVQVNGADCAELLVCCPMKAPLTQASF